MLELKLKLKLKLKVSTTFLCSPSVSQKVRPY
jgi:hypothetical protein